MNIKFKSEDNNYKVSENTAMRVIFISRRERESKPKRGMENTSY
jgi:hypothetical protein